MFCYITYQQGELRDKNTVIETNNTIITDLTSSKTNLEQLKECDDSLHTITQTATGDKKLLAECHVKN